MAARLRMLDVAALVIDANAAVGDNWRRRYGQLVLHDPIWFDHMPLLPFPSHFPVFMAKDKIADFLEAYARLLELAVSTRTTVAGPPAWDDQAKEWTVVLATAGEGGASPTTRRLRVKHIVQATGHAGEKHLPAHIRDRLQTFRGDLVCHSAEFVGPKRASSDGSRRAVVVGSCTSAHDIAQDYLEAGYDVTMVQRSSTCVVSSDSITRIALGGLYFEDGPPVDDADLLLWATPAEVLKAQHLQIARLQAANDAATLRALADAGFRLDRGPDAAGLFLKYLQRGSGYYIDVGASALIAAGKIKLRHASGSSAGGGADATVDLVENGLRLADGQVLPADEIVFATGYQNMASQTRNIFGDELADAAVGPGPGGVWGFDAEGEMKGIWRQSGHPGFWIHGGNLAFCRYFSRLLALQITAALDGICQ